MGFKRLRESGVGVALPALLREQVKDNTGVIRFQRKNKDEASIFLRAGAIYAIEVSTYSPNIVNRILTNEFISKKSREQVIQKYENNLKDFSVVDYVLKYSLFPEKPLIHYLTEFYFDAFQELSSWKGNDIKYEWKLNEIPQHSMIRISHLTYDETLSILDKRKKFMEENMLGAWSSTMEELQDLQMKINYNHEESDYAKLAIITVAKDYYKRSQSSETSLVSLGELSDYLGFSFYEAVIKVFELWYDGIIDIVHPSGLQFTNREDSVVKSAAKLQSNVYEEEDSLDGLTEAQAEQIETIASDDYNKALNAAPVETISPDDSGYVLPSENVSYSTIESDYSNLQENPAQAEYAEYTAVDPNTTPQAVINSTAVTNTEMKETMAESNLTRPPTIGSVQPPQQVNVAPNATGGRSNAASKLKSLAEQMREAIRGLEVEVNNKKIQIDEKRKYRVALQSKIQELENEIKTLQGLIEREDADLNKELHELQALEAEYNENKNLLN